MERSVIIDGSIVYTDSSEILSNPGFEALLKEFIDFLKEKNNPVLRTLDAFKVGDDYNVRHVVEYLHLLTLRNVEERTTIINYVNPEELAKFVESLYSFWRSKHRFIMTKEKYTVDNARRTSIVFTATMISEEFKTLVRNLYRTIMKNISADNSTIVRQLPSGLRLICIQVTQEIWL